MQDITLDVRGMSCGGCVNSVRQVLMELPGVEEVEVVLETGKVSVHYDPNRVDVAAIKAAIADAGYEVA